MADEQTSYTPPSLDQQAAASQAELADITSMLGDLPEPTPARVESADETEATPEAPESKAAPKVEEKKAKPDAEPKTAGEAWKQARAEKKAAAEERRRVEVRERELDTKLRDYDTLKARAALLDRVLEGDPDALEEAQLDFEKLSRSYIERNTGDAKLSKVERELAELKKLREADEKKARESDEQRTHAQAVESGRRMIVKASQGSKALAALPPATVLQMADRYFEICERESLPAPRTADEVVVGIERQMRREYEAMQKLYGDSGASSETPAGSRPPSTISGSDTKVRGPQTSKPYDPDAELLDIKAELAAAGFR